MSTIHVLSTSQLDFDAALQRLTAHEPEQDEQIAERVKAIIRQVRAEGDQALLRLTRELDGLDCSNPEALEIPLSKAREALSALPQTQQEALRHAAERIRRYHEHQRAQSWQYQEEDGTVLGQQVRPLARAGIYVPGGKAAYPSSVLMNAIPAKVAGVSDVIMVTPASKGQCSALVLAAAAVAGVDRIFTVGGAQAVAALAYGTDTIPAVDKIVGPGNAYVAEAKRQVFGAAGIDMVAGPSEILIICDGETPVEWTVMDLFSQAEHDEMAKAVLLCPDAAYLEAVKAHIEEMLPKMARRDIIAQSLSSYGALIHVQDLQQACEIANRIAPEHLELSTRDPAALLPHIHHAGAIFMGRCSSEALGDYCAGPNHVLPTARTARFSSPLGVYDFQKRSSIIQISPAAAKQLGMTAAVLAKGEGLQAHALSAEYRFNTEQNHENS